MERKCGFSLFIIVILLLTSLPFASATPVLYPGEGAFEPSPNSIEPFNPQLLQGAAQTGRSAMSSGVLAEGYTVTVNPLALNFPNIVLYVTLLDGSGNSVTGRQQSEFTIAEKSTSETTPVTETITSFSESATGGAGISVGMVFDVSGSMYGQRLTDAKSAAIDFINNCRSTDRVSIVSFSGGSNVNLVSASNFVNTDADHNGTPDVIEAINSLAANGTTAVYDGTAKGIDSLSQEPAPKAVIVFTDGDTNSDIAYSLNTVIQKAQNEALPLYTIGLGIDPQNLKDMAAATGGQYRYAPTAADMAGLYSAIAQNVRSQYTIGYSTHNPNFDGTTRTVTVSFSGASGQGFYVVNHRPTITLDPATIQLSSQSQTPGASLTISGFVTDLDAQARGQQLSATLFCKAVGAASYASVSLPLMAAGNSRYNFSFDIPPSSVLEPGVLYFLHVTDGLQESYYPFNHSVLPLSISVLQNHAPVITHTPISSTTRSQPLNITATVVDNDPGDGISNALLFYRVHDPNQSTPYRSVSMTSANGLQYTATIPADSVEVPGVDYFISAWDTRQVRADKGSSDHPYQVGVDASSISINITDPASCAPFLDFSATINIQ